MFYPNDNDDAVAYISIDTKYTRIAGGEHATNNQTGSTSAVVRNLFANPIGSTELLPPVVRYLNSDFTDVIVERPPMEITVEWNDYENPDDTREYKLFVPWTVYALQFLEDGGLLAAWAFSRGEQIEDASSLLQPLPLPNIYEGGAICVGNILTETGNWPGGSLASRISNIINLFWQSKFNNELFESEEVCERYDSSDWLEHWSNLSLEKVLDWNLPSIYTLETIIKKMKQTRESYFNTFQCVDTKVNDSYPLMWMIKGLMK